MDTAVLVGIAMQSSGKKKKNESIQQEGKKSDTFELWVIWFFLLWMIISFWLVCEPHFPKRFFFLMKK